MNKRLIFVSAAFLSATLLSIAAENPTKPPELPAVQEKEITEVAPNFSVRLYARKIAEKITAKNKAAILASNPLADASVFKPDSETMMASSLKKSADECVVEEQAVEVDSTTDPDSSEGRVMVCQLRIPPSNT